MSRLHVDSVFWQLYDSSHFDLKALHKKFYRRFCIDNSQRPDGCTGRNGVRRCCAVVGGAATASSITGRQRSFPTNNARHGLPLFAGRNVWKGVLRVRSDLQRVLAEALKKPPITRSGAPSSADD